MSNRSPKSRRSSIFVSPIFKLGSGIDLPYLFPASSSASLRRISAKALLESLENEEVSSDTFWEKVLQLTEEQFQLMTILIFRKDPTTRKKLEIDFLERLLQNYSFFKEIKSKISFESYRELFLEFRFESHKKDTVLFNYGDVGKKFYVILSGSVFVLIPRPKKTLLEQTSKISRQEQGAKINRQIITSSFKAPTDEERLVELFPHLQLINTLKEGDLFGEISLSLKEPRTATVVCREDSSFGVLNAYSYDRILKNNYESELRFLKKTVIFNSFSLPNLAIIKGYFVELHMVKDHIIYSQKDSPDRIYIVKEGEIELVRTFPCRESEEKNIEELEKHSLFGLNHKNIKQNYQRFSIGILGEGETFGEEEVFLEKPRLYSAVVCSMKARVLAVNKENLLQNLKSLKSLNSIQSHCQEKHKLRINQLKELRRMQSLRNKNATNNQQGNTFRISGLSKFMESPSEENKRIFLETVNLKHIKKKGSEKEFSFYQNGYLKQQKKTRQTPEKNVPYQYRNESKETKFHSKENNKSLQSKKTRQTPEKNVPYKDNNERKGTRFHSQENEDTNLKQFEISPILKMCAVSSALSKYEKRKRKFSVPNVKQMLENYETEVKKSIANSAFKTTKEFKPKENVNYLEENRKKLPEKKKNNYQKKILMNSLGIKNFYFPQAWYNKNIKKEQNMGFLSQRAHQSSNEKEKDRSSFYPFPLQ